MMSGKIVGKIVVGIVEANINGIKIIGLDGVARDAVYGGYVYEGEKMVSDNSEALFQIKYLAFTEPVAYDGVFTILTDASVITLLDGTENIAQAGDEFETAAGEEGIASSSQFFEETATYNDEYEEFYRGEDTELGLGITSWGVATSDVATLDQAPPVITSSNVIVFDENATQIILQVTSNDVSAVTYSIAEGLDSALFALDTLTGELTFINPPNYENPQDLGADNEYNVNVTVTDALGNYTTQLISVFINNVNEAPIALTDAAQMSENQNITIDVLANDTDVDADSIFHIVTATITEGLGSVSIVENQLVFTSGTEFDYLAAGETATVTIAYTMSDEGGLESSSTLTLNVTGTNDTPILALADTTGAVTETSTSNNTLTDSGVIAFSDVDLSDIHVASVSNASQGALGTLSAVVNADNTAVTWTYSVADADVQYLAANETKVETFDVTINDDNGGTSTQSVAVTITGTNDTPIISAVEINATETNGTETIYAGQL